jgi:hypothetical protein
MSCRPLTWLNYMIVRQVEVCMCVCVCVVHKVAYLCRDLISKEPTSAARRDGPRFDFFGVTPDEIAKRALVGNLLCSRNDANLV